MTTARIVSHAEWLEVCKAHLAKEKEFTRLREELSRDRRALPWEPVDEDYHFFNFDYGVSFRRREGETQDYNYGSEKFGGEEKPGISAFRRGDDGGVYHTYSTYARGLDMLNGAYHLLDLTSKGRDEQGLSLSMSWVRRHDQY
jgi:predicted dithiol-disulfide oxidoreductase (DUF899 family)